MPMNRNDFLQMIERSGPTDRNMVGEVGELINIFPYFQSAYMLLLKGLHNTADVRFENQLRSLVLRIADREVLYYYLKKEQFAEVNKIESNTVTETSFDDKTDHQQTVIDSAKSSDDLISEIEKVSEEEKSGKGSRDHNVVISSIPEIDDQNATIIVVDEETGDIEEKIFYMDPGFSFSESKDLLELTNEEGEDTGEPETVIQESVKTVPTSREIQADLIEKFILSNPRIEPAVTKSNIPNEDISKPFVEEHDGLLTETLAKIYTRQGYYSRAIDIYEKLSLKFPEKSGYFASQIEKVKELIKK